MAVRHDSIYDLLRYEEGEREAVYLDTKGIPTGGIGHAFHVGSKLPMEVWDKILFHDVETAWAQFESLDLPHMTKRRKWVCVSMIFQLGLSGFKKFTKTITLLRQEEWKLAADEMLRSKWAREDSPARAKRMAQMMREG